MSEGLTRFRIEALHNRYTIDVPIIDNKLVLVGENGTMKSTVANFIYFFLTQQWFRMPTQSNFKSITAIINSEELKLTKAELTQSVAIERFLNRFPPSTKRKLQSLLASTPIEELINDRESLRKVSLQIDIPTSFLEEYIERLYLEGSLQPPSDKLKRISQSLTKLIKNKVLYLPTYRRIEQDLAAIFPAWRSSTEIRKELEKQVDQLHVRAHGPGYVELVEFGMKDVEDTIAIKMRELKDELGAELSKLTSTYLRDVIFSVYQKAEPSAISELDESTINAVFNRIDQTVLPKPEQQQLREIINEIKTRHDFQDKDKVVVHFLTKLIDIHRRQQEKERGVRDFVEVCNQYLSGKKFVYDNINFDMSIRLQRPDSESSAVSQIKLESEVDLLEMSKLSSGEKQIVSLFSQIYLSESSNYFIIIDEPELSLSVPWQKRFLPDILNTKRCAGLIAVTHSPYIFDNILDEYTHSIESFTEIVDVAR